LLIATYQNRRYDSDFLTLKKLIDRGAFGEIVEFESRFDRFRPKLKGGTWKEQAGWGSGIVFDLGSHLIDQVLTLFGTPDRVSAHIYNARRLGPAEFDDTFFANFFYDRVEDEPGHLPLIVSVRGSPLSAFESQLRYAVRGTKGSFLKHGIDTQEDQLKLNPPISTNAATFGVELETDQGLLTTVDASGRLSEERIVSERGNYLGWYENVGLALQAGDPSKLYVTPQQARETIRMIEVMYESSRTERVIHVNKS